MRHGTRAVSEPPIDIDQALQNLGGDRALFNEVVATFLDNVSSLRAELQSACSASDARRLQAAAHTLKGAVSNLCAERARALAAQLEDLARTGDLTGADVLRSQIEFHLDRLSDFARSIEP